MRGEFTVRVARGAKQQELRPLRFEAGEDGAHALLAFGAKDVLETIIAGRSGGNGSGSQARMARAGAKVVNAEIHGGAIQPAGDVFVRRGRKGTGVELQEGFVGDLFGSTAIAEQAAEESDKAGIGGQEEFVKGLGRKAARGGSGAVHGGFWGSNPLKYSF